MVSRARQIYPQNYPIYSFSFYNQQKFVCVISFAVSGYRKCLCCNLINITLCAYTITSTNTGSDTNTVSDYCSRTVRISGFITVCL